MPAAHADSAHARDDPKTLTGMEKAAVIVLALGEENAVRIFTHMTDDEIREISQTMAGLGTVGAGVVEKLFVEFVDQIASSGSLIGSLESTERLLAKVLGKERVENIMEDIRGPAGRTMWDKLANVSEAVLASYLKNEYPQTVAVVVSKIKPAHAARVLAQLPEGFAMEVILRMLRMESVQKDVLDDIERILKTEFMSNLARTNRRDPHEAMAEIFNNLDRSAETRFIGSLEERNHESAEKIKSLMFTFEDFTRLDGGAIQSILRAVDKNKLPLALKGTSEELKTLFFKNMSERAARLLREDIASLGPTRLHDIEEAQNNIAKAAKDLAAKGEIIIAKNSEEDQLVY